MIAPRAVELRMNGQLVSAREAVVKRVIAGENDNIEFVLLYPGSAGSELMFCTTWIRSLPFGHRQYLTIRDQQGELLTEALLDAERDTAAASPQMEPSSPTQSFVRFLGLGVEHILEGYDHLLFLLGILVVSGGLPAAVKVITSFTVAHSITLVLATMGAVRMSPSVVEPLIAASILYIGIENLLRREAAPRWILTFVFGLVHGLGFASVLSELGVGLGLNGQGILLPLAAFNLGIELGQIAAAAVALPLFLRMGRRNLLAFRVPQLASAAIAATGLYWLIERVTAG
jgi:hydrogenase/urease accessory protein HupE